MALNPKTNSAVFIDVSEGLDHETLNKAFANLISTDIQISRSFVNTIGVWHSRWYYNSNIVGYSEGDIVWLNTEEPLHFLKTHNKIIKQFTDLKAEILTKLPDWEEADDSIVDQYMNAMTGYVENKSVNSVPLEPIFEIGDYNKPIQLAVSLKNNNKSSVHDKDSWKILFVDSEEDEENIISSIMFLKDKILENHLLNYHLSGREEFVTAKLSDYLDAPGETEYDAAPSAWYASYNASRSEAQYGLDYVLGYVRKPFYISGNVSQYQAVRYWKSGWTEHFGTVAINNPTFELSDGIYLKVPFNWKFASDKSNAVLYKNGELAESLFNILSATEDENNLIPPEDNLINVLFENQNIEVNGKKTAIPFKDSSYNLVVFPVYQDVERIEYEYLFPAYGDEKSTQSWNANFLTNEIIESMKNKDGFSFRIDSRIAAPYISYYATGMGDF